jgi:uncharacterized protein (DUF983 family)
MPKAYVLGNVAGSDFVMNSKQLQSPVTTWQAVMRGFRGRCPHCGEGKMFRAYLKVADECPACHEELHHQRADDFPAYLVIILVGHIVVPLVLHVETVFAPPTWVHIAIWMPVTIALCLAFLQPIKGAVVALQWATGMLGFEPAHEARVAARQLVIASPTAR